MTSSWIWIPPDPSGLMSLYSLHRRPYSIYGHVCQRHSPGLTLRTHLLLREASVSGLLHHDLQKHRHGTGTVTLDQQHYCETIVRDFTQYIDSRNYSEVPMQVNANLFVPYEPTPDQAAWVARFPYATTRTLPRSSL
jgi:hypothetical protein